jgi:hypothetical protein
MTLYMICVLNKGGTGYMITKYVKFDYFQVTWRPKGAAASIKDQPYDLRIIINQWNYLDLQSRTIKYKQERARLEKFSYDAKSGYLWDMYFCRLRDFNLPSRARENEPSEPIDLDDDEYIGENVSAIYDENNYIIMIQRNKYSLGPAAIEEYVNTFADPEEEINFRPISMPNPEKKFRSAEYVRKLRIKFSDIPKIHDIKNTSPSVMKWLKVMNEYEPINAEIILSVGKKRNKTLGGNLRGFVEELFDNRDFISKAEASIKLSELTDIEVVDLFAEYIHDIATFKVPPRATLNHEAVIYEMKNLYEKRRTEIVDLLYNK